MEKKPCEVNINFKIPKDKIQHMYNATRELRKAGITFDTGGCLDSNFISYDWSLKGGVEVFFKKYKEEVKETKDKPEILNKQFKKELEGLLNLHCIENECDMPDFLLAEMIVNFIIAVGKPIKKTLDWHGCDSVCHPKTHNQSSDPTIKNNDNVMEIKTDKFKTQMEKDLWEMLYRSQMALSAMCLDKSNKNRKNENDWPAG